MQWKKEYFAMPSYRESSDAERGQPVSEEHGSGAAWLSKRQGHDGSARYSRGCCQTPVMRFRGIPEWTEVVPRAFRSSSTLQHPCTIRVVALMRLNRRIPNGMYSGVRGRGEKPFLLDYRKNGNFFCSAIDNCEEARYNTSISNNQSNQ